MVHGVFAVCLRFMASVYSSKIPMSIHLRKIFFGQIPPHFFIDKLYSKWQNLPMNKGVHSVHFNMHGMAPFSLYANMRRYGHGLLFK